MPDLVVNLYGQELEALGTRIGREESRVRRALVPETHLIFAWVQHHFSQQWESEVRAAMAHQPPGCVIAHEDDALLGFACFDATARGYFGPMGVAPQARGRGLGQILLYRALMDMKTLGYGYAIIGASGPTAFYERTVGAAPLPFSGTYTLYRGIMRGQTERARP